MGQGARKLCQQRLRMRNEMFGFPLTEERLKEIEEGKNITPVRLRDLKRAKNHPPRSR
jgi:hypothetical protein